MGSLNPKKKARLKRKKRIRKTLCGSQDRPRLSIFRSSKHIYAQVIDDTTGNTFVAASSVEKAVKDHQEASDKVAIASFVGALVGERAIAKGVKKIVFDRNGFLYHGRVKALSDAARKAGLDF